MSTKRKKLSLLKKNKGNPSLFKRQVHDDTGDAQDGGAGWVSANSLHNSRIKVEALRVESEYLDEKLANQEVRSSQKQLYKLKSREEYVLEKNSFAAAQAQHQLEA